MSVTLSQNEIRARAARFAETYKDAVREEEDAQSFQNDFFQVLGIARRRVATFEKKVKCRDGSNGYIDLFWKGHILIEMKSLGKDREKAYQQARRYADTLKPHELPRAILICDFQHWDFYDLDKGGEKTSFTLEQLPEHICLFHYLAGYGQREYQEEDPVNVKAAELMGRLHDALKATGYEGHPLEVYLVRLLFCLFADDTGIFNKDDFLFFIKEHTAEDGDDLAARLAELFQVLNTPESKRLKGRNEQLAAFPYVNGGLFAEMLPMPAFDAGMRRVLLDCCSLDWGGISPAIFGSMFQSVMKPEERRALGAHYTSERNILKLINPLFMDSLRQEFRSIQAEKNTRRRKNKLQAFHDKLASLTFLDPACGCGNFLVVSYRELRLLELEVLQALVTDGQRVLDVSELCRVQVHQFYGIEIEEFPAQIAQVALWLIDHQMNRLVGEHLGQYFARIPLKDSATIICGNALRLDWSDIVPKEKLSYILGNPPFSGARFMGKDQKADLMQVFNGIANAGDLDFVACWFKKAADLMSHAPAVKTSFVATNSLCQGQSVAILWKHLLQVQGMSIHFAYRTFKWSNEGRNRAAVHCVIVGFGREKKHSCMLYDEKGTGRQVSHINGYLADAPNIFIENRMKPLCDVPEMGIGNKPIDDGNYIFTEEEKEAFLAQEPKAEPFMHPFLGSKEYINRQPRYCLWLGECAPDELRHLPECRKRIEAVRAYRAASKSEPTRKIAATPRRFHVENMPKGTYIAIPEVSSERRNYIPIGFLQPDVLCSNKLRLLPDATLYHFGILTSRMHMAWLRAVCCRLKSDYSYSAKLVYNNFPWPEATEEQKTAIGKLAQAVLDARAIYPNSSLADLYDPDLMPDELTAAHRRLDAAVEKLYRKAPFADDAERVAYLFEKYSELVPSS